MHNFRDHFTKMKKLDEMDERDGVVVGERLGSGKEELVSVLKEYDGFGTLMRSQPWFVEMMGAILLNSLKTGKDVACGVHELTAFDGQTIGRSFSSSLATTLTGEAAVDEWACRFRAVKEVRDEERSECGVGNASIFSHLQLALTNITLAAVRGEAEVVPPHDERHREEVA